MSQQVLVPGIDPTTYPSISGAELLQLVEQATYATGVGGIIVTTDTSGGVPLTPDANTDPTLQNYVWVRIGNIGTTGNFASGYVWNPNNPNSTDPLLLNWTPLATLSTTSIDGSVIVANSIPATALMGGITASQVVGLTNLMTTALTTSTQPSPGDISGSFLVGFSLKSGVITSASFTDGCISRNSIFSGQVIEPANVLSDGASGTYNSFLGTTGVNVVPAWMTRALVTLADPTTTGLIPVSTAANVCGWKTPSQIFAGVTVTAVAVISVLPLDIHSIVYTNGSTLVTATLNSGSLPFSSGTFAVSLYASAVVNATGSWLATATSSTTFTYNVTTAFTSSATITNGTLTAATFTFATGSTPLNIAPLASQNTVGLLGEFLITFSNIYSTTNYAAMVSMIDASATSTTIAKIVTKSTSQLGIGVQLLTAGAPALIIPTVASQIHIICI
jgi:hypothetical protein